MKKKKHNNVEVKEPVKRFPYETVSNDELLKTNSITQETGLSEEEVLKRRETHGLNKLQEKKKKGIIALFFSQLNDPMIYILIFAAVLSFVLSFLDTSNGNISFSTEHIDIAEPIIILFVVLLNGFIGTIQEAKAEKSLEALKKMSAPTSVVRRNGKILTIPEFP